MDKAEIYRARVNFTESQINALRKEDCVSHTQPVCALHFPYNNGSLETGNWAIFRFALQHCNYACKGYLCLKGRSLVPTQLKRGLRSSPFSQSHPTIVGVKIVGLVSGETKSVAIQHFNFFQPDLHCEVQPPDVQLHRLMKLPGNESVEPIFVDLWFLFLPPKDTQLVRCPERPFTFGPIACRPVSTMLALYEERDQTGDVGLNMNATDDMETVSLKAHKNVLRASSEVFFKMFDPNGDFVESKASNVDMPPVTLNSANLFIRFIYTGHFGKNPLGGDENQAFCDIFDLTSLGDYYEMPDLKSVGEKGLMYYIKRDTVTTDEIEDHIFYPLNSLTSGNMEISYVIYLSLLLYGLLKVDSIEKALEYCYNKDLEKDISAFKDKANTMCMDGPATCDYCRLIQNKLNTLRFTDMFI